MLQPMRRPHPRVDEEGFTLIELMVVVLIIAILLAIAIPTFLGARSRAQNRAAESNLRNALTAEKTSYTDSQLYVAFNVVSSAEPSLSFVNAAPSGTQVEVTTTGGSNNVVCLLDRSSSGMYYELVDVASTDANYAVGGTFYASGDNTLACPSTISAAGAPTGAGGGSSAQFGGSTTAGGW